MSSSALRREAMPAAAMIFWRRSAGIRLRLAFSLFGLGFGGEAAFGGSEAFTGGRLAGRGHSLGCCLVVGCRTLLRRRIEQLGLRIAQLLELFHAGQLADVLQAEAQQEFLGRLVEDGPPDNLLAAGGRD